MRLPACQVALADRSVQVVARVSAIVEELALR